MNRINRLLFIGDFGMALCSHKRYLWHSCDSVLGLGNWHWFLLYETIKLFNRIKRLIGDL